MSENRVEQVELLSSDSDKYGGVEVKNPQSFCCEVDSLLAIDGYH